MGSSTRRHPAGAHCRAQSQRERAEAALNHARAQCGIAAAIDAGKIDAFARLMNEKLDTADANTRKGYIHSIIDAIEVDDKGHPDRRQQAYPGRHRRQTDRERKRSWFCTHADAERPVFFES
jgi:hypothetical protein